jgi:SAM-dependent methyltransferase
MTEPAAPVAALSPAAARPVAPRHGGEHETQVRRLFDAKATTWPAKYAAGGALVPRLTFLRQRVIEQVPPGGRVLDLGCGTGELAASLAAAGLAAVGCDISPAMLRSAAAAQRGAAGWVQLAPCWRRLPFAGAGFDAVTAASVLEYTVDPRLVLAECARVLRPGGVLLCTVPSIGHPVRWLEGMARSSLPVLQWPRDQRWERYLAYLRASRQHHRLRWWLAAARSAGLYPLAGPAPGRWPRLHGRRRGGGTPRGGGTLRLLALARVDTCVMTQGARTHRHQSPRR